MRIIVLIFAMSFAIPLQVLAWGVNTHFGVTITAAEKAENFQNFLKTFGLDSLPKEDCEVDAHPSQKDDSENQGYDVVGVPSNQGFLELANHLSYGGKVEFTFGDIINGCTATNVVGAGAILEDSNPCSKFGGDQEIDNICRSLRHFFDPISNDGMLGKSNARDWATVGDVDDGNENLNVFKWGDDDDPNTNGNNDLSLFDYFKDAVVGSTPQERMIGQQRLFVTLGHISHLLEDMFQPAHVRDDEHGDKLGFDTEVEYLEEAVQEHVAYEGYGNEDIYDRVSKDYLNSGTVPVVSAPAALFTEAATFTNANFFSTDTIFDDHDYTSHPSGGYASPNECNVDSREESVEFMLESGVKIDVSSRKFIVSKSGQVGEIPNRNLKTKSSYSSTKPRLAMENTGLDDEKNCIEEIDIGACNAGEWENSDPDYCTMDNELVILDNAMALLPKAVAYPKAIINHFFRGELKAKITSSGDLELKNSSEYPLVDGTLRLFYETQDGTMVEYASGIAGRYLPGYDAYKAEILPGGTIQFMPPVYFVDLPPVDNYKQIVVLYDGLIGEERGVAATRLQGDCKGNLDSCVGKIGRVIDPNGISFWNEHNNYAEMVLPFGAKFEVAEVVPDGNSGNGERDLRVNFNTYNSSGSKVPYSGNIDGSFDNRNRWEVFPKDKVDNDSTKIKYAHPSARVRLYPHAQSDILDCFGCNYTPLASKTFYVHSYVELFENPYADQDQGGCQGSRWALASYVGSDTLSDIAKLGYVCEIALSDTAVSDFSGTPDVDNESEYVAAIGGTCPAAGVWVVDQWNYYKCECTSYVAWNLNENNGVQFTNWYEGQHWGDAKTWQQAAINSSVPVDNTPQIGDVAWWDAWNDNDGKYGHVAYVESVNADGTVNISEYNFGTPHGYGTRNNITADAYIHVGSPVVTPPPLTCPSGEIQNCNGGCTSQSWIGNGECNAVLNCSALNNDGGDCNTTTPTDPLPTSCSGDACNGLNPETTDCSNGATTVGGPNDIYANLNGINQKVGTVELRWSSACQTNWSRVIRTDGGTGDYVMARVVRDDGVQQFREMPIAPMSEWTDGQTRIWSPMVYAPANCSAYAEGMIDFSFMSSEFIVASQSGCSAVLPPDDPAPTCPSGEVEDCSGGCSPQNWVGDSICDDSLNCSAFSNDGGDCGTVPSGPNPVEGEYFSLVTQGFGINAHTLSENANVNMWTADSTDPDQQWIGYGSNNIQRYGTNLCLNAYNPASQSNVNLWTCDLNDPDQQWQYNYLDATRFQVQRIGTSYCLNAHTPYNGSNLNLFTCDSQDPEQIFENTQSTTPIGCPAGTVEDCDGGCTSQSWVGDGICDDSLNCSTFSNDEGDCNTTTVPTCPTGTVEDCDSGCTSQSWVGDGICDDSLNCSTFSNDEGDCNTTTVPTCPSGTVEDCDSGCTSQSWVGDGICDDSLNCSAFSNDGGDCNTTTPVPTGCPSGEVEDCNGGCSPQNWVGDSICDDSLNCSAFSNDGGDCGGSSTPTLNPITLQEPLVSQISGGSGPGVYCFGTSSYWHQQSVGNNGSIWTQNHDSSHGIDNYCDYNFDLAVSNWEVLVWIPPNNATTHNACYKVSDLWGTDNFVLVDQMNYYDEWVSLGVFAPNSIGQLTVTLTDLTFEGYLTTKIGFDAIKVVPTSSPVQSKWECDLGGW